MFICASLCITPRSSVVEWSYICTHFNSSDGGEFSASHFDGFMTIPVIVKKSTNTAPSENQTPGRGLFTAGLPTKLSYSKCGKTVVKLETLPQCSLFAQAI
jgi:hypothetical protein